MKIQVQIKEPTREITLNAIDIKVHEANVSLSEYGPSGRKFRQISSTLPKPYLWVSFMKHWMNDTLTEAEIIL